MAKPTQSLEYAIFNRNFIRSLLLTLLGLTLLLLAAHIFLNIIRFDGASGPASTAVDLDTEGNLATWFNSTLDMMAALAAVVLAWLVYQQPEVSGKRTRVLGWLLIGGVLFYLGMDDASSLHETLAWALANFVTQSGTSNAGLEISKWQLWIVVLGIPGIIVLALASRFFYRNIWHLRRPRWLVSIAVALFLLNPLQEIVEGRALSAAGYETPPGYAVLFEEHRDTWLLLAALTTAQEAGEMVAAILFLGAFLYIGESILLEETRAPS